MSHLVCTDHKKRVMVLSDGTAVHRENSVRCFTNTVRIGTTKHDIHDVLYFHVGTSAVQAIARMRHTKPKLDVSVNITAATNQFAEAAQKSIDKINKGFKNMTEVLLAASPAARLLHDIYSQAAGDELPETAKNAMTDRVIDKEDIDWDSIEISYNTSDKCHCGRLPTHTSYNSSMDGYCDECTATRCDAFPLDCPFRNEITKRPNIDAFLEDYRNEQNTNTSKDTNG